MVRTCANIIVITDRQTESSLRYFKLSLANNVVAIRTCASKQTDLLIFHG